MKQLTVLVDIHCLYTSETGIRKGLEQFIDLANRDSDNRHKYIFTPKVNRVQLSKNFRKSNYKFFRVLYQIELLLWKQIFIPLKAHLVKADVLFTPDYYAPIWKLNAHKVVMFHDTFFWDSPEHYGKLWLRYFKWVIFKGIEKRASVITITNFAKERIVKILPIHKDVEVIYHPRRKDIIRLKVSDHGLGKFGLEPFKYFLHVGVFEKRKELPLLVRAFKQFLDLQGIKNFKLLLVGKKAPNSRFDDWDEVVRLVAELGLSNNVQLPGYLSDYDIMLLYSKASSYVFPSNNEGFGLPIIEAFAMNCPVIISDQGALMEVAGNGALVFKNGQSDDLCSKLMEIAQNNDLRNELINKGTIQLEKFNRDTYFKKMEAYFNKVVKRNLGS